MLAQKSSLAAKSMMRQAFASSAPVALRVPVQTLPGPPSMCSKPAQQSGSRSSGVRAASSAAPSSAKTIGQAVPVKVEDGPAIMDDIDCIIFDCDGGCGCVCTKALLDGLF